MEVASLVKPPLETEPKYVALEVGTVKVVWSKVGKRFRGEVEQLPKLFSSTEFVQLVDQYKLDDALKLKSMGN